MGPTAVAVRRSPAILSKYQSQGVRVLLPGSEHGLRATSLL